MTNDLANELKYLIEEGGRIYPKHNYQAVGRW